MFVRTNELLPRLFFVVVFPFWLFHPSTDCCRVRVVQKRKSGFYRNFSRHSSGITQGRCPSSMMDKHTHTRKKILVQVQMLQNNVTRTWITRTRLKKNSRMLQRILLIISLFNLPIASFLFFLVFACLFLFNFDKFIPNIEQFPRVSKLIIFNVGFDFFLVLLLFCW